MERRLAAILAADVVGYSRLIGVDETGTLAALRALLKDVVEPALKHHRGRVVKLMGDGLLAEFASIVDAVTAAVKIQQTMSEQFTSVAEDRRIALRVGVNIGDVVVEDGDIFGDGVNIAARLQEIADPNGVAVSQETYRHLRGKLDLPFVDAGEKALKNIVEPVRVWLWSPASTRADAPLSAPALALLTEMRERADVKPQYLFPGNAPGKALQGIKKFWRDITEQAGLEDYRLHDNRHTLDSQIKCNTRGSRGRPRRVFYSRGIFWGLS